MTTTLPTGIPRQHGATATRSAPAQPQCPPTLTARQAPPYLISAGYDVARRAIGYRLENLAFEEAVTRLLEEFPREEALRIAEDYLAFGDLEAPEVQVDALFTVENARYRLEEERRPAWRRLLRRRGMS